MKRLFALAFVAGCHRPDRLGDTSAAAVHAIYDPARSTHYFDLPFPSNERIDAHGHADLSGFPTALNSLTAGVVDGWVTRIGMTTTGFSNNGAVYFRFDGHIDVPSSTEGTPTDPFVLVDMETGELLPLEAAFIDDPAGDPFWAPDTLAFAPAVGHPPRSGATLAAVVMQSSGALPPEGYVLPDGVQAALDRAGITDSPAIATVYTVQDATGQLEQLMTDVDTRLGADPDWSEVTFKRVIRLDYTQGETESGKPATLCTATFEDGTTETAYMEALQPNEGSEADGNHSTDLLDDWPMVVYEAYLPVLNYSGLDDQPYMSPGVSMLQDTERYSGWIDFEDGELADVPDPDFTRIVVSIPKGPDGQPIDDAPVVIWDHGTGGSAYNSVQRRNGQDDGVEATRRFAEAGWAVIGRDAPLYGTRYPLIDEGFTDGSTGFYNIVNLPAFRDNQRQAAAEAHILERFIQTGLNDALPAGSVDPSRIRRFGHSMGSVTTNLDLAAEPDAFESALLSGSGGVFSDYFLLDQKLVATFDPSTIEMLFTLFGADVPDEVTPAKVLAAALGLPEAAWDHVDRLHPVITLFQWIMDPSDPMAVARDENLPITLFMGVGDWQVPNVTTLGLENALPQATLVECETTGDYDPHNCLYREQAGFDALATWLSE